MSDANLALLSEVRKALSVEEIEKFDQYLIGVLADKTSTNEWKDAIRIAHLCFDRAAETLRERQ